MYRIILRADRSVNVTTVQAMTEEGQLFCVHKKKAYPIEMEMPKVLYTTEKREIMGQMCVLPKVKQLVVYTEDSDLIAHWVESAELEMADAKARINAELSMFTLGAE